MLLVTSLLGLVVWSVLLFAGRFDPAGAGSQLKVLARSLAAALLLAAGGLRLAAWRLSGVAEPAWHAIGLIVIGVALSFVSVLGILGSASNPFAMVPGRQLLIIVGILALLFGAFSAPIQGGLRPLRTLVMLIAISLTLALVLAYRTTSWLPAETMYDFARGAEWVVTGLWAVLAGHHLWQGRQQGRVTQQWAGIGFAVLAVSEMLRATGLFGLQSWTLAAGSQAIAALLLLASATTTLWELLSANGTKTLRLTGDLELVRTDLMSIERHQRERLHDARTAVVSVLGASRLLSRPDPSSGIDPAQLHRMMTAELHRLGAVLDPQQQTTLTDFDIADVLEPLILAHRIAGAEISTDLRSTAVVGRAPAFATAVANVMSNARTHAAGSPILIRSRRSGDTVELTIEDDGPGIAAADRQRVLLRGVRGQDAAGEGSGIGLYTAEAAMHVQGGTLRLDGGPDGGTTVTITLPAAQPQAPALATGTTGAAAAGVPIPQQLSQQTTAAAIRPLRGVG